MMKRMIGILTTKMTIEILAVMTHEAIKGIYGRAYFSESGIAKSAATALYKKIGTKRLCEKPSQADLLN